MACPAVRSRFTGATPVHAPAPSSSAPDVKRRTLRGTLAWLFAGLIAPLAIATLALLVLESQRSAEVERDRLGLLAKTLSRAVDAELARARTQLEVLAASPQFARGDLARLHAYARAVAAKLPGAVITLVDADGQALLSTGAAWGEALPNYWLAARENRQAEWNGHLLPVGSEDLSRPAVQQNRVTYSNLFYGVNTRRPTLALALPVEGPAGIRRAFVMSFPPDLLQDMVSRAVDGGGVRVIVVDRNGVAIASNAAASVRVGGTRPIVGGDARESGPFRIMGGDNQVLDGAFSVSPVTGFVARVASASPPLLPRTTWTWLLVLVLASGAAVAVAAFFARNLARPIAQLAADLSRGRGPRSSFRSDIVEFQLLAQAVDAAAEAQRFRRVEEECKLAELNDRALFAEQMVGIVSHDLRNPLLAAQLSATALQHGPLGDEGRTMVRQVLASVQRAQALVHGLLDFTRARLGKGLPVDLAPIDLHRVIADHLETLRRTYPDNVLVHEKSGAGQCEADADRLVQLADNLVNNAVTYGLPGEPILVRTSISQEAFSISVRNLGEPIPPDVLPHIFKPMVRSRDSGGRNAEGVGLGLYIVHEIARAHAGDASVTSTRDDGTAVTATFPR